MVAILLLAACAGRPESAPVPTPSARVAHLHVVDCTGAGDFLGIQDAISVAHSGDTIQVRPCTYFGNLNYEGKTLRIESTDGAATTVIAGVPGDPAVYVHSGEGPGTALVGFTVTGGGQFDQGAIDVNFSTFLLDSSVVTGGLGSDAVHGRSAHVTIRKSTITQNSAVDGWAVYSQRGGILLTDSVVTCDGLATGVHSTHGQFSIDRTTIDCPGAQSFWNEHSIGRIQRSHLVGQLWHEAQAGNGDETWLEDDWLEGGALATDGPMSVRNCVITGAPVILDNSSIDSVIEGSVFRDAVCGIDATTDAVVRNSAFFGLVHENCDGKAYGGSSGNLSVDCQHVDPTSGDWRLQVGSPCIDAGPSEASYDDVDGTRNDIGVFGGPFSQGGGW